MVSPAMGLPIALVALSALRLRLGLPARIAASDFPTSSDSLKRPFAPRRTYRLSVLVSISVRFAARRFTVAFFFATFSSNRNCCK